MEPEQTETMGRPEIAGAAIAPRIWRVLTIGGRLNRRIAIVAWSAAIVGSGLLLSWNWLVAAGLSTIVLAILPCAAMCAAGLCMGGADNKRADASAKNASGQDETPFS
ncbi:MAG TPA: hypothetical protein VGR65_10395 [Casimicrobiaceae bacterium]|jgi:hypothetical protein|nr:hypothetical protein [Casimicrobiaceae bacterium]